MALKDLVSDLSNFKGQTNPRSIDKQIENGVNFIPNDDATGFTPKADLESLYEKHQPYATEFKAAKQGTNISPVNGNVSPYADLNPLEPRRSAFLLNSNGSIGLRVDGAQPPSLSEYSTIAEFKANQIYRPFNKDMKTLLDIDGYSITSQPAGISRANPRGIEFSPQLVDFPAYDFNKSRDHEPEPYHWSQNELKAVTPPGIFSPKNYKVSFGRDVNNDNLRDRYKDGSVHVESGDTLLAKAGGDAIISVGFSSLTPIVDRTSQFQGATNTTYSTPESFDTTQTTLNIPAITTTGPFKGVKNVGPFRSTHRSVDAANISEFDVTSQLMVSQENLTKINNKISFSDNSLFLGQFTQVPKGLGLNLNPSAPELGNFRDIADPFTIEYAREPYILRQIPSGLDGKDGEFTFPGRGRWGVDATRIGTNDVNDFLFSGGNSMFRGAPTLSGLIVRTAVDKIRIGQFLKSPRGISFTAKQIALQALNPAIETRFYNPGSLLGISTDVTDPLALLKINFGGTALPIAHVNRHLGGLTYEDVIDADPVNKEGSRLVWQSKAMTLILGGTSLSSIKSPTRGKVKFIDKYVNKKVEKVENGVSAATATVPFSLSNPNKYSSVLSSAPISVSSKGGVSFFGGPLEAFRDVEKAITKKGGTFSKDASKFGVKTENVSTHKGNIKHASLLYGQLKNTSDGNSAHYEKNLASPTEVNMHVQSGDDDWAIGSPLIEKRKKEAKIVKNVGQVGSTDNRSHDKDLGTIKKQGKNFRTDSTDKINMIPYGRNYNYQDSNLKDFIKFKFEDMVMRKFIIFRAILEGVSDSIAPEYGEERYVGRPDKVYTYQGADRTISFNFSIYPKTKQELPILMEKLNYLVGLCYPSYTEDERMVSPFIKLTLGDMFNGAPGLLSSLNITVEDQSTWELDEGLQFPHFIKAQCEFKYIGNHVLASTGKHYGIGWIPDGSETIEAGENRFTSTKSLGFRKLEENPPNRKGFKKLYDEVDGEINKKGLQVSNMG